MHVEVLDRRDQGAQGGAGPHVHRLHQGAHLGGLLFSGQNGLQEFAEYEFADICSALKIRKREQ